MSGGSEEKKTGVSGMKGKCVCAWWVMSVCEVEEGRDEGIKDDRRDARLLAWRKHVDQGWSGQKTDVIKGHTSDATSCDLRSL